jgi:large repetitive protein
MSNSTQMAKSCRGGRRLARRSRFSALLIGGVLATALLSFCAGPAFAATTEDLYVVASGGESAVSTCHSGAPACTLTWALTQATSGGYGGDEIVIILAPGTYANSDYTVTGGSLNGLTFESPNDTPDGTALDGAGTHTDLTIDVSYPVTVQGLTLQNGGGAGPGADLLGEDGAVSLDYDVISGGVTTPDNSGLVDLTAGSLDIDNTTIENGGTNMLGAFASGGTAVSISNSTITGEYVGAWAEGAVALTITSSTFDGDQEGVVDESTSGASLTGSTVSGATIIGVGVDQVGGVLTLGDDILADGASHDGDCADLAGTITDADHNVTDDNTCAFGSTDGNKVVSTGAIGLLPLASNGGPTQTQRIASTSAAYDILPDAEFSVCGEDDQRGIPRLQAGTSACDAGAYQVAPPTLTAISSSSGEGGSGSGASLTGTNLAVATTATFGASKTPGTITQQTSDSLTVTVPVLTVGSQPITVTNPDGSATIGFTELGPTITTRSLPAAEIDHRYSHALAVSGGFVPLAFSVAAGTLPAGLTLSSTGTISGTPSRTSGTFAVEVKDPYGDNSTATLSLAVLTPAIAVDVSSITLKGQKGTVKLACRTATCNGNAQIVKTVREKVKKGKRTIEETKTIVLASGAYTLAAGNAKSIVIKLTKTGSKELHPSKAKPLRETLLVTVTGGRSERRTVTLN